MVDLELIALLIFVILIVILILKLSVVAPSLFMVHASVVVHQFNSCESLTTLIKS